MPVYSFECPLHGIFELSLPLRLWDDHKGCTFEGCTEIAEQVVLPNQAAGTVPPIVIHVAEDGSFRFPGAADARVPPGFQKKELHTIREIEQFERDVNRRLTAEAHQHHENEDRHFGKMREQARSDLRMKMQQMSERGRDFARFAMALNDRRRRKSTECGFHVEILHFDQTNREAHSDERTQWKRKHA